MYSYNDLVTKLGIEDNDIVRAHLKAIVNALIVNNEAYIAKQMIYTDLYKVEYLWNLYLKLSSYFDYRYNSKIDLTKFFSYILSNSDLNLNAIFCPGYTDNGYKNYIGGNNSKRLSTLKSLKEKLENENIKAKFHISLADIFLENTDNYENTKWKDQLLIHTEKFVEKAKENFTDDEIVILSDVFSSDKYIKGFVETELLKGKNYDNFYKNNEKFYKKMNWSLSQTKERNDKLYTIYTIISRYINSQSNGIYLPMETMYSRSKVMTHNKVCTMYLHK